MKKLSIVIPAYNVKDYLSILIDSIYQPEINNDDFEVIIVNDGSNDGTAKVCDELNRKYSNMLVIHQKNSGSPSGPRNRGVVYASGKYVFFADADDYFFPDAVKKILEYISSHDVDVALFKVDASDWGNNFYHGLFSASKENCNIFNSKILNSLGPVKLFKRSLIVNNNIKFSEEAAYEDLPFVLEAYFCAKKISIIADMSYYKYVKRKEGGSLSTIKEKGGIFGIDAFMSRVNGIINYFDTCSRLADKKQCPQIYVRGVSYSDRLLPKLFKAKKLDEIRILKEANEKIYCDEIRALLPFTTLCRMDALVFGDINFLQAVVSALNDTKVLSWVNDENKKYMELIKKKLK